MNFESKHLIRYGIPGWIFIFWIALFYIVSDYRYLITHLKLDQVGTLIGVFISLGVFGIVIGFILHYIYFFLHWLISNKTVYSTVKMVQNYPKPISWRKSSEKDYFHLEYTWYKELLKVNETSRTYLIERYRYMLSTIHTLGTMMFGHIFSAMIIFLLGVMKNEYLSIECIIMCSLQLVIAVILHHSFAYYSRNLINFQGYFLNDLLNNNITEIKVKNESTS